METLVFLLLLVNAYVFFMVWREGENKRAKWRKVGKSYALPHWAGGIARFFAILWRLTRGTARVLSWLISLLLFPFFLFRMFPTSPSSSCSPEETTMYYAMLDEEDRLAQQNAKPIWPPDNDWFPD